MRFGQMMGMRGRLRLWRAVVIGAVVAAAVAGGALASSIFDEPESKCGEPTVVFAQNFGPSDGNTQNAYLNLTRGVYILDIYTTARLLTWHDWGSIQVLGWDRQGQVSDTNRDSKSWPIGYGSRVVNPDGRAASEEALPLPDGVVLVKLYLPPAVVSQAPDWRWEISEPGVCERPESP